MTCALGILKLALLATLLHAPTGNELKRYPWLTAGSTIETLEERFPAPEGFHRVPVAEESFGAYLRGLPLRPVGTAVRTFDGRAFRRAGDPGVAAVAELDLGSRDLQQCADSVIRLHAEWLWSQHRGKDIGYHFTSGDLITWNRYAAGDRPRIAGDQVTWAHDGPVDSSRSSFRAYLDLVFTYAGTLSVETHSQPVPRAELAPGDFFVTGKRSHAGHAILVLDMVEGSAGRRRALIGEGYMPAQDFHLVATPEDGAWVSLDREEILTPFWAPFPWSTARRMKP